MADEEEYESDPEQAKLSLKMRRRTVASDDEDEDDIRVRDVDSRASDCESDGQGAAAEYYDDDDENEDDEYDDLVEEIEEVEVAVVEGVIDGNSIGVKKENDDVCESSDDNVNGRVGEGEGGGQGEKKENEPFAVPTAGAFYMHDDRFRDSAGGRHRRSLGRGMLWELRDERKWGHDKFEELTMHERHYDEGRRVSRGRNRVRGSRSRGEDNGFVRGNRPKTFNNSIQTNAPKSVRGRGPRRYQPSTQNSSEAPAQSKQSKKSVDKKPHASSGRASAATSSSDTAQVPVRKNLVASNLNSASPPFYPSGSSNKQTNTTQKKDVQTGLLNRGPRPPVMVENYPISQPNNARGRNVSDSLGMDKLYIDDSVSAIAGKPLNNLHTRSEGRGPMNFGHMAYQPVAPHHNQVNRVPNQLHPNQQFVPRSATGSRASSPPKTPGPVHANESTELESSTESNDSKTVLVGRGKGSIASSGMSSFSYGSLGGNHGDQNFPGAPTFLPVMQFPGQHPGGLGVPAVGMAFPGYVGQPNGMGNSEMTWLPVLAGAAGALGAAGLGGTYPYITMDGTYHARPSGKPSSLPSLTSKDNITNKLGSEVKPSQRPELANDDLRQRQNKARRYTEMTFDK